MTFSLFQPTPGRRTTSQGGRPARMVPHGGMPAYESETGALLVMENLVAFFGTHGDSGAPVLLPVSYGITAARAPTGLAALHDDQDAVWSWRPILYTLKLTTTERLGSQNELGYRQGLSEACYSNACLDEKMANLLLECAQKKTPFEEYRRMGEGLIEEWRSSHPLPYTEANARAEALLVENLNPQQRLELARDDGFHVRGTINKLYWVAVGNGASIVDPRTHEQLVSLCLHTDDWIPDADVALATKLLIESGKDGEKEMLGGARPRVLRRELEVRDVDVRAWEIEQHLLPTPYVEV